MCIVIILNVRAEYIHLYAYKSMRHIINFFFYIDMVTVHTKKPHKVGWTRQEPELLNKQ